MTDTVALVTPTPEIVVAPVVDNTPVVPAVVIPAPEVTPVEPVVAPVVAPVVEPVVSAITEMPPAEAVKPAETALGEALDKTAPKPDSAPVEAPVATEVIVDKQVGQSDEPAPPPSYEAFKLPEGIQLEPERLGSLTKLLGDLEVSGKVEHAAMQEFGQKLIDTHINEVKSNLEGYQKLITATWDKQKVAWKEDSLKDPELGGNRFQTTIDSALSFIRTHGGTPEEQTEFRNLMEVSGLGNHKAMIRILAKAGMAMTEGKPLAAQRPATPPKSKISTMYGNK